MNAFSDRSWLAQLIETEHWGKRRSIRALERELGTGNGVISKWCIRHGIKVRPRTEQTSITNSGPDIRRKRGAEHWAWGHRAATCPVMAAHRDRMRAHNPSTIPEIQARIAASRSSTAREHLTPEEQHLFDLLGPAGAVAQHPVGSYLLDLAFVEQRVAIEVDGKGHWTKARAEHDIRRDCCLIAQGWTVLRVANASVFRPRHLLDVLAQFVPNLQVSCPDPPKRRGAQYGVLVRDAQDPTGRRL